MAESLIGTETVENGMMVSEDQGVSFDQRFMGAIIAAQEAEIEQMQDCYRNDTAYASKS